MALLPCPISSITQQALLDLLGQLLPPHYIDPLREVGPGYEVLQAYAKLGERVSQAAARLGCDSQITTAESGSYAAGEVELFRASPNTAFNTPIAGQAGTTANLVAGAPSGQMRVTGLTNMSPASVGRFLSIDGANVVTNNGTFQIAGYLSPSSVDVFLAAATVPDANNGAIVWSEASRDVIVRAGTVVKASRGGQTFRTIRDAAFIPAATAAGEAVVGQAGSVASIVAGAPVGQARVTGLTGMAVASIGRFLVLTKAGSFANIGRFRIVGLNSATSVDVIHAGAVVPDPNNGAIEWREESAATPITATAIGYEWNIPGEVVTADGTLLPGEVDTVDVLVEDPPLGDPTIQVVQRVSTTGGKDAALDSLGSDRGVERTTGEADEEYRIRVRALPDTISPDAFRRAVEAALLSIGVGFTILETWDLAYQTCWDAPSATISGSSFDPNLCTYDDPDLDAFPFRNRWMDENERRGCVVVVVENMQPIFDVGMAWDDVAADVYALVSPSTGGVRSPCAFDVPADFGFGVPHGGYDGFDPGKDAVYKGLYQSMQNIKAGGVAVALELKGE